MNFCIDIGNTNTVAGMYSDSNILHRWRIATDTSHTFDDLKAKFISLFLSAGLKTHDIKRTIISSVVPIWNHNWERFILDFTGNLPLFIGPGVKTGIKIAVENPKEVGADRIVNAAAAIEKYKQGAIIIDSGTAITIDIVSPEKSYLGGAIMPGIIISVEALASKTAKLSRIEISKPDHAIGKTTSDSIRSGIYFGFAGMVDRIIEETLSELSFKPKIIATGGLAGELASASKYIEEYDRDLTLRGLDMIAGMN